MQVLDSSLHDIKYNLNPVYPPHQVALMDVEVSQYKSICLLVKNYLLTGTKVKTLIRRLIIRSSMRAELTGLSSFRALWVSTT
jgi:hypothetical protein